MAQTALDIANQGIVKGGGAVIGSFNENVPLAVLAQRVYPQKKASMLARHRWVFAKQVAQLQPIVPPAGCPRAYAFQRPADLIGQIHDYRAGPRDDSVKVDVLQVADHLAADTDTVWVEYTRAIDEAAWPSWFVDVVVCAFAIDVANAKQRRTKAAELLIELQGTPEERGDGGLIAIARQADSINAPKRTLEWENGGPLVEARFAGSYGLNDSRLAAAILRNVTGG